MRICGLTFLILSSLVCAPNSTSAQTSADETRQAELQDWVRAYKEWKAWADEWLGKRQPGWFGARDRKEKPDPPAWLSDYCRDSSLVQASFAEGCRLLADWRDDLATALIREQIQ